MSFDAWHWPQFVVAGVYMLSLAMGFGLHGQDRAGKHNAGLTFLSVIAGIYILHEGGFW